MQNNMITSIPTELVKLEQLETMMVDNNFLDCDYVQRYLAGAQCTEQKCLEQHKQ